MFRKVLLNVVGFGTAEVSLREISLHVFGTRCPPVDLAVEEEPGHLDS